MSSSSIYSVELPYLGAILSGKSPLNLLSFQKPLRDLYITYCQRQHQNERRIIITDNDIIIFEPDTMVKCKQSFIYANFKSIVDVQILKLSVTANNVEEKQNKSVKAAFLPIGCENQERFHSLYSKLNKSQYGVLDELVHPPLLLFIIRKPGVGNSCSLLDCHVFDIHRESIAFDFCDMIRKQIIRQTMSPTIPRQTTIITMKDDNNENQPEKPIKYLKRDRPSSIMEYQSSANKIIADKQNNLVILNVNLNDNIYSTTNVPRNPSPSSSLIINNVQHSPSFHDTSEVLAMNRDIDHMSTSCSPPKERHFIKASSIIKDESDEIVNDLLNIVAVEQTKSQISVKRQASFDQISNPEDNIMYKKRFVHNKKRLSKPISMINNNIYHKKLNSMIDSYLSQSPFVLNQYGDIGNYVPKFLRDTTAMRSSDSNENIFFRSTNGELLNGFLNLDFSSRDSFNNYHHNNDTNQYPSPKCLNNDDNIYSLVQQLRNNQQRSFINIHQANSNISSRFVNTNHTHDQYRVPCMLKTIDNVMKAHELSPNGHVQRRPCRLNISPSKPKRAVSLNTADMELPIDYRRFLRQTDRGAFLYGEEQRQQQQQQQQELEQATLEHSLGYYP